VDQAAKGLFHKDLNCEWFRDQVVVLCNENDSRTHANLARWNVCMFSWENSVLDSTKLISCEESYCTLEARRLCLCIRQPMYHYIRVDRPGLSVVVVGM
jgi:hypothetical protein